MNLGTIKARVRALKASPTTSRWNDALLAQFANDASLQLALKVDFPQATQYFDFPQPPAAPTLQVHGAAGSRQAVYAAVAVASTGGGDSVPSPNAQVADAPDVLSNADYVAVTLTTVKGAMYRVLRQIVGVDTWPQLLTTVVAAGDTIVVNDQGQYAPQPYKLSRGNEIQLPELVKVMRAYILSPDGSQQPLTPSDISWLGGDTNETFDNTSGTILGYPQFTPQWLAQTPVPFPVQSPVGGRVQVATPWRNTMTGTQDPVYALRGGYIIVLPPPQGAARLAMDFIPKPPVMQQNSDLSIFPDAFADALALKMLEYMAMSDDDSRNSEWAARFEQKCSELRIAFVDTIQANKPHALVPLTLRTQMREWPT